LDKGNTLPYPDTHLKERTLTAICYRDVTAGIRLSILKNKVTRAGSPANVEKPRSWCGRVSAINVEGGIPRIRMD